MSKPGDLDWLLDQMVELGRITEADADEIRRFRDFLAEAGPPNGPYRDRETAARAYRKHYPEETG